MFSAKNNYAIDREQLCFKVAGFLVKGRAEIFWNNG
jgi:hypothetical protein